MIKIPKEPHNVPSFGSLLVVGPALICVFGVHEELHLFEDIAVLLGGMPEAV
jgi:hypothetical protein